jgi:hypothetical protein
MNQTTIIGGPFAGVLHSDTAPPLCGAIHITVMENLPDLSKGDQHIEHRRGVYNYKPETREFHYTSLKT